MNIALFPSGYTEAAKWGHTPQIQASANTKVKEALTDRFVRQVEDYAKKDAQKGEYMSSAYIHMQNTYIAQHVSPDRSGPMAQTSATLQDALRDVIEDGNKFLDLLFRQGDHSARVQASVQGQTAEIYSPEGEMIAGYNSLGGGWTVVQTKAETKFHGAAAQVYAQAFREARSQLQEEAKAASQPEGGFASIDIKA